MPGEFSNPSYISPSSGGGASFAVVTVANAVARLGLALVSAAGYGIVQSDDGSVWALKKNGNPAVSNDWARIGTVSMGSLGAQSAAAVAITGGTISGVSLTTVTFSDPAQSRAALGLGSVSNTADADKPVSTAQAAADAAIVASATAKANAAQAAAIAAAASDATTKANAAQAAAIVAVASDATTKANAAQAAAIAAAATDATAKVAAAKLTAGSVSTSSVIPLSAMTTLTLGTGSHAITFSSLFTGQPANVEIDNPQVGSASIQINCGLTEYDPTGNSAPPHQSLYIVPNATVGIATITFDSSKGSFSSSGRLPVLTINGNFSRNHFPVMPADEVMTPVYPPGTGPSESEIQAERDAANAAAYAAWINTLDQSSLVTATATGAVVTLTAVLPGVAGNSITLAISNPSTYPGITLSGPTLTGGSAANAAQIVNAVNSGNYAITAALASGSSGTGSFPTLTGIPSTCYGSLGSPTGGTSGALGQEVVAGGDIYECAQADPPIWVRHATGEEIRDLYATAQDGVNRAMTYAAEVATTKANSAQAAAIAAAGAAAGAYVPILTLESAPADAVDATYAATSYTITGIVVDGEALTVDGVVFTFRTVTSGGFDLSILGSMEEQAMSIRDQLNAHVTPLDHSNWIHLTAGDWENHGVIHSLSPGTAGNSLAVSTTSSAITLGGSVLTGGEDALSGTSGMMGQEAVVLNSDIYKCVRVSPVRWKQLLTN